MNEWMSDVTPEQHIFLRWQLQLDSDDKTDWCVQRTESAVKASVGPYTVKLVTVCTLFVVLYCIVFIFDSLSKNGIGYVVVRPSVCLSVVCRL